jgi:hypothetical protein
MQNRMAKTEFINVVNQYCYFGYKWKSIMNNPENLIDYTHRSFFKLKILNDNYVILEGMKVDVSLPKLKIITITVWIINIQMGHIVLGEDYCSNISICEKYILDEKNKTTFDTFKFKIIENDNIFTIMDSEYNLLRMDECIKEISIKEYVDSIIELC